MKKTVLRTVCFFAVLFMFLGCWNSVFRLKYVDGIYDVTKFYQLDNNTVDVLFIGSSHAFESFNTGTLWDAYGIAGYILGGSKQPMWNTYYYLKEALKTQTPKLIVLEGFALTYSDEYSDDSRIIKNNYGLKWSVDKINSLTVSAPRERWREFFLDYTQYHTRYKELTEADFLKDQGNALYENWKGFCCNMATKAFKPKDLSGFVDCADLYDKTERYYRAILELAHSHGIPIAVVITPYVNASGKHQQMFNRAQEIAAEYSVPFLNCNLIYSDIGLDYATDMADKSHLNHRGNQKFSKYIGQYIVDHFDIPDRRGNEKYKSWQDDADFIRQMIQDRALSETFDPVTVIQSLSNPNYWVFVSVDGTIEASDGYPGDYLNALGMDKNAANGVYYLHNGAVVWKTAGAAGEKYLSHRQHDIHLKSTIDATENCVNVITIDNNSYQKVENGVNVIVYDTLTGTLADCFGISATSGKKVVR